MRHSCECCTTVAQQSCENRATIWRENKTKRNSYECRATVVRIKMKISYIRGKVVRHSHECRATVARYFSKFDQNSRICHISVFSMRLQRDSCVYIVNLCSGIVANCSQTSLQLSHSSEIGALRKMISLAHFPPDLTGLPTKFIFKQSQGPNSSN